MVQGVFLQLGDKAHGWLAGGSGPNPGIIRTIKQSIDDFQFHIS